MRIRAVLLLVALAAPPAQGQTVPEPDGYRLDAYRAPVPATLQGARVLDTAAAFALWQVGTAAFIDVFPRPPKPPNLPEGTIWIDKARDTIPGALWLPNTGYGRSLPGMDDYLRAGLMEATGGDPTHPVVFFCLDDCWMSWNAARRALLELGYSNVAWYPEGTDGWLFEDHPVETLHPWSP